MPKKKSSKQKLSPLEIARLLSNYDDANRSSMIRYPGQRSISAFDIPLILDLVCITLTSDELWICRRVCRAWHTLFERPLWNAVRLTTSNIDRRIQLLEAEKQFFQDRVPWIKRAIVNMADLQLVDFGCAHLQHLQLRHSFYDSEWLYDFFSDEDPGEHEEEDEDMDGEVSNGYEGRVAPSALSLIGMNTRLSCLILDWDSKCRPLLSQAILDQFMQSPVLTEFELQVQNRFVLEDVKLFFSHCPLSVKELRLIYWGLSIAHEDDEVDLPDSIAHRPFRPLPSLERFTITGMRPDMENEILFPFLRHSCSHLQRLSLSVLDDDAIIDPETVDSILLPTGIIGSRPQDRSVHALLVTLLIHFCPYLKEYMFEFPLPECDLYRLVHRQPFRDTSEPKPPTANIPTINTTTSLTTH